MVDFDKFLERFEIFLWAVSILVVLGLIYIMPYQKVTIENISFRQNPLIVAKLIPLFFLKLNIDSKNYKWS